MKKTFFIIMMLALFVQQGIAQQDIFSAAAEGNKKLTKQLLKQGVDINDTNRLLQTPLFLAAKNEKFAITKLLIKKGADINKADFTGTTPLMTAVEHDNLKMIKYFLKKGAAINAVDNKGWTAILLSKSLEASKLLVGYGGDIKHVANNGVSALMVAAEEGNLPLCRFLIEKGANPQASDKTGLKAVDYAKKRSHQDIVDYLLSIK